MTTSRQPVHPKKRTLLSFGEVVALCLAVFLISDQFDKYYLKNQQKQVDYSVKDTLIVNQTFAGIDGIVSTSIISKDKDGNRYNDLFRGDRYAARTRAGDTIVVMRAYRGGAHRPDLDRVVANFTLEKLANKDSER